MDDWPDELQDMWNEIDEAFHSDEEAATFADMAADLFDAGFVHMGEDSDFIQWARDEFFALMEEYDISIDVFDWDDWRDWYEAS